MALSVHRRGRGDPAFRVDASGAVWRTSRTPDGPATLRISLDPGRVDGAGAGGLGVGRDEDAAGVMVLARAWGPGSGWLLETVPDLLGASDDRTGFHPQHPVLREMDRRYRGLRIGRSGRVLEALVRAVLEQ
jgi:hypothetical protein